MKGGQIFFYGSSTFCGAIFWFLVVFLGVREPTFGGGGRPLFGSSSHLEETKFLACLGVVGFIFILYPTKRIFYFEQT